MTTITCVIEVPDDIWESALWAAKMAPRVFLADAVMESLGYFVAPTEPIDLAVTVNGQRCTMSRQPVDFAW